MAVSSPRMFYESLPIPFISKIKNSNSSKQGWGGISYSDAKKYQLQMQAGERLPYCGLALAATFPHLPTPLSHTFLPILFSFLLKFCV